jgi:hypothetical protein
MDGSATPLPSQRCGGEMAAAGSVVKDSIVKRRTVFPNPSEEQLWPIRKAGQLASPGTTTVTS